MAQLSASLCINHTGFAWTPSSHLVKIYSPSETGTVHTVSQMLSKTALIHVNRVSLPLMFSDDLECRTVSPFIAGRVLYYELPFLRFSSIIQPVSTTLHVCLFKSLEVLMALLSTLALAGLSNKLPWIPETISAMAQMAIPHLPSHWLLVFYFVLHPLLFRALAYVIASIFNQDFSQHIYHFMLGWSFNFLL